MLEQLREWVELCDALDWARIDELRTVLRNNPADFRHTLAVEAHRMTAAHFPTAYFDPATTKGANRSKLLAQILSDIAKEAARLDDAEVYLNQRTPQVREPCLPGQQHPNEDGKFTLRYGQFAENAHIPAPSDLVNTSGNL